MSRAVMTGEHGRACMTKRTKEDFCIHKVLLQTGSVHTQVFKAHSWSQKGTGYFWKLIS